MSGQPLSSPNFHEHLDSAILHHTIEVALVEGFGGEARNIMQEVLDTFGGEGGNRLPANLVALVNLVSLLVNLTQNGNLGIA